MKAQEIRNKFSQFFQNHQHQKIKSSSLIPIGDNTILFANAGMNQFKDYFTGKANATNRRAVTIQKCVRAGGKHNDLENVGFTARHHTFFEMLGNFSFGDYFKTEAIEFAWNFLTKECGIDQNKLLITIHQSDDEAFGIWNKHIGVPAERIFRLGDKSNFWEMGEVGPCGPCTEIFYDHGEKYATGVPEGGQLVDDEGRFVEIWNLVFMQFEKKWEGSEIVKISLPKPSVDTGAGLERLTAVLQGKYYNYDTDIFEPIMNGIEKITQKKYTDKNFQSSFRVVADHIRAATMLITDGALPSNEGRGYVLRRIIRRAIRHLSLMGVTKNAFFELVPTVFQSLGEEYPDNASNQALATKLLKLEEEKFRTTLDKGLDLINEAIENVKSGEKFKGDLAFKLYDTFGFPLDLTEVILREKNIELDSVGFEEAMKIQRDNSKKSGKFKIQEDNSKVFYELKEKFGETKFRGYENEKSKAKLLAKVLSSENTYYLIFDQTPFYAESGGQKGDRGQIATNEGVVATIIDTIKPIEGIHAHLSQDADHLVEGEFYDLIINFSERQLTMKNHSATHLLQAALIKVLGSHVKQAGSSVGHERLRFDFTHPESLSSDEILVIEKEVNNQIQMNLSVSSQVMTKDKAQEKGAMALFGEKYGDEVRVIEMGGFSCELCGGTHVKNTGDIQYFKIIHETSTASGIRRIEAITGQTALDYLEKRSLVLQDIERSLSLKEHQVFDRTQQILQELRQKNKVIDDLKHKLQEFESELLFKEQTPLKNGLTLAIVSLRKEQSEDLKSLAELYVDKYPSGLVFIYSQLEDKVSFIFKTSRSNQQIHCSNFIKEILPIMNGKGGGKPDHVQGSGDAKLLPNFLKKLQDNLHA